MFYIVARLLLIGATLAPTSALQIISNNITTIKVTLDEIIHEGVRLQDTKISVCGIVSLRDNKWSLDRKADETFPLLSYIEISPKFQHLRPGQYRCIKGFFRNKRGISKSDMIERIGGMTMADADTVGGYWITPR